MTVYGEFTLHISSSLYVLKTSALSFLSEMTLGTLFPNHDLQHTFPTWFARW